MSDYNENGPEGVLIFIFIVMMIGVVIGISKEANGDFETTTKTKIDKKYIRNKNKPKSKEKPHVHEIYRDLTWLEVDENGNKLIEHTCRKSWHCKMKPYYTKQRQTQ